MSTVTQSQQAMLPEPEAAFQTIFAGVHNRVLFHKLASLGYPIENEKQANAVLELAGKLEAAEMEAAQKSAVDLSDPFIAANIAVDRVMTERGLGGAIKQARSMDEEASYDQAASEAMRDPNFYNSILSLKAAEAQDIDNWYKQQLNQSQTPNQPAAPTQPAPAPVKAA